MLQKNGKHAVGLRRKLETNNQVKKAFDAGVKGTGSY
jgi:hypothetical protein